jgi:hypothetical protein
MLTGSVPPNSGNFLMPKIFDMQIGATDVFKVP